MQSKGLMKKSEKSTESTKAIKPVNEVVSRSTEESNLNCISQGILHASHERNVVESQKETVALIDHTYFKDPSDTKMTMPHITFVLQPDEKNDEIKDVFGSDFMIQILNINLHEFEEEENEASILAFKCKEAISKGALYPVITDITRLHFHALSKLPGILIKTFTEKLTPQHLYKVLEAWDDKSAYLKYSLGLLEDEYSDVKVFQGYLSGTIVKPENKHATGWQSCFVPDGYTKPYTDLPKEVKLSISEKKKALRALKIFLISKEFFM